MRDPMVVLCPGQGAQVVGMGVAWCGASPAAAEVFARADEVLGDAFGAKLSTICREGPDDVLNRTDVSQPALYVCGVASWAGMCERASVSPNDAALLATAGLSLGEYTALTIAGALEFEDGLRVVQVRGRAMQDAAEAVASGMVALIGADEAQAQEVCDEARGDGVLVCANFNAPGQVVVSGDKAACERAASVAADRGFRVTPLAVAGAFHSPIMRPAAERLAGALSGVGLRAPRCTVMSNVTAEPHAGDDAASIRARLVEQLTSPVRWSDCARWMAERHGGDGAFVEIAPGKSLAGMMRRIDRGVKVASHPEPAA